MEKSKHIYTPELRELVKNYIQSGITDMKKITELIFGSKLNKLQLNREIQRVIRARTSLEKWGDLDSD